MTAPQRYPAFDALRASAMELGLVLHAAVPYTQGCPSSWAVCDPSRSGLFDLANTLIHAVRMPAFFLMSGFFAALLWDRVGTRAFLRHRVKRIVVPFVVACLVLVPLTRAIWIWGAFARPIDPVVGDFIASLSAHFHEHGLGVFATVWHLWFLEYLLIHTAVFVGWQGLFDGRSFPGTARLGSGLTGRARAVWLVVPTAIAMGFMSGWNVDGVSELAPVPHLLAYYGLFFAAGAVLFSRRAELDRLAHGWRAHLLVAVAVVLPGLIALSRVAAGAPAPWVDVAGRVLSAVLTCSLLYGVVGFFWVRFSDAHPTQRYLSDAAYFVYLTHFPLIAALGICAASWPLPAALKFAGVLGVSFPLLLALYHTGVRYRGLGRWLHGPRERPVEGRS
ncbi:MAG: acyltransferase family protein [Myxococcota bacterium]